MLRPPGNATLATHRSVVVTYDFGSSEHAVVAHPAAVTAAHTPKNARRVAIDPYWLVVQQDSWVAANALTDGGVDERRSKWASQMALAAHGRQTDCGRCRRCDEAETASGCLSTAAPTYMVVRCLWAAGRAA